MSTDRALRWYYGSVLRCSTDALDDPDDMERSDLNEYEDDRLDEIEEIERAIAGQGVREGYGVAMESLWR